MSFYRYIVTVRGMAGMASWPFGSPSGRGPRLLGGPLFFLFERCCRDGEEVSAHGAAAHRPGEAYAEPSDEREELEYSRSTLDTRAQRDVSPSVGRVFGPGVGPTGPLDQETYVPAPYGDCDTSDRSVKCR